MPKFMIKYPIASGLAIGAGFSAYFIGCLALIIYVSGGFDGHLHYLFGNGPK